MSVDAIVNLDRLRCIREGDRSGGSEPYAWTALFWIDERVFTTRVLSLTAPDTEPGYRTTIKSGMREGDVASMPSAQRRFVQRFPDAGIRRVGVVVALAEEDEFPNHVVRSAYRTFLREFPRVVGAFVVANAREPDGHERDDLIREIRDKIVATIRDALTAWEKIKDFVGVQDRDDFIGVGTEIVDLDDVEVGDSRAFTLDLPLRQLVPTAWDNESQLPTAWEERLTQHYQVEGRFEFRAPPPPDPCQAEIDRVTRAQAAVTNTKNLIRSLQADLHDAPPGQKPHLLAEIREHQQELPQLETALSSARRALDRCRGASDPSPPAPPPPRPRPRPDPIPPRPRKPLPGDDRPPRHEP